MKLRVALQQTLLQNGTAEVEVTTNRYADIMQAIKDVEWHEPYSDGLGERIVGTEEIMELGELSQAEIDTVFHMRALAIARSADRPGQFTEAHSHKRGDKWYFWPMGRQPEDATLAALLDTNIIIAARKYKLWMATGVKV